MERARCRYRTKNIVTRQIKSAATTPRTIVVILNLSTGSVTLVGGVLPAAGEQSV